MLNVPCSLRVKGALSFYYLLQLNCVKICYSLKKNIGHLLCSKHCWVRGSQTTAKIKLFHWVFENNFDCFSNLKKKSHTLFLEMHLNVCIKYSYIMENSQCMPQIQKESLQSIYIFVSLNIITTKVLKKHI